MIATNRLKSSGLVDHHGRPLSLPFQGPDRALVAQAQALVRTGQMSAGRFRYLAAKYDAAQTTTNNENHWANADNLDPHSANSANVRRKIRSRSRYEVVENNPYLKGVSLTICNDFVGTGPKLTITDPLIPKDRRRVLENHFRRWAKVTGLRKKLWRMRLAKMVDGESFMVAYRKEDQAHPVQLNFHVLEADRVSSDTYDSGTPPDSMNQVDGVRFDRYENPLEYFILKVHPGTSYLTNAYAARLGGNWVSAQYVVHWFRQDRGWLRGIPETSTSLPLCALLRRYTLAVVRSAEVVANFSAVLETEGPPSTAAWTDGQGNMVDDDPFDMFPLEMGMITTLPWGYKLNQMKAEQPTTVYDAFVDALLREIVRPLLLPFNLSAGSSKDSNMASGVLDAHVYAGGQRAERTSAEEDVLDQIFRLWWSEAALTAEVGSAIPDGLKMFPPDHEWRWDRVTVEHTDPLKVAMALKTYSEAGLMTDRQIQETHFNRDVDDWREEVEEDREFRKKVGLVQEPAPTGAGPGAKPSPKEDTEGPEDAED